MRRGGGGDQHRVDALVVESVLGLDTPPGAVGTGERAGGLFDGVAHPGELSIAVLGDRTCVDLPDPASPEECHAKHTVPPGEFSSQRATLISEGGLDPG